MSKAEDLGQYYRIPPDLRDLNYSKFVEEGEEKISHFEDYNSHNTERLDGEGLKALLVNAFLFTVNGEVFSGNATTFDA